MHLAFLHLEKVDKLSVPSAYIQEHAGRHAFYTKLRNAPFSKISHVQRAAQSHSESIERIEYNFIEDEFGKKLRWWQEPAPAFELLALRKPDFILVAGLDLPLNFRWLRRLTGIDIRIIGHHTGETIWPGRNLWLQQFGLRVVDAFLFHDKAACQPWTKSSVILVRQPIYIIPSFESEAHKSADLLSKICEELNQKS